MSPSSITFDPQNRYLLLSSNKTYFALAPFFLNLDSPMEKSTQLAFPEGLWKTSYCQEYEALFRALTLLPSRAMSQAVPLRLTRRRSWFALTSSDKPERVHSVRDCVYLEHSQSFVCIVESEKKEVGIFLFSRLVNLYKRQRLHLPYYGNDSPRRIFVYDRDGEDSIVICCGEHNVTAILGQVVRDETGNWGSRFSTEQQIGSCRIVSQSANKRELIIVSDISVKILDLCALSMTEIQYRVSLHTAFKLVGELSRWKNHDMSGWWQNSTRRVSDDGRTVLLGWDIKRKRSLVLKPDMQQVSLNYDIQSTERCISEFCSLSSDGNVTIYVDIDQLSRGSITLSTFDETSKPFAQIWHTA